MKRSSLLHTFGGTDVTSSAQDVPIRCGATPIPVQSRLCRGTLRYPTAWLARSVATFRYQKWEPSSPAKKPGIGRELPLLAKAVPNKRMEPVVAATEAEAIAQVTEALGHWLAAAKVIHVTVPGEESGTPWLHAFGRSATDPDFPEFLEELQRLRTLDTSA